jgi:thiamine monophosphate kinase
MDEREVLARVRAIFDREPTDASLIVGNGDDGAVFSAENHMTVVATDMARAAASLLFQ